MQITYDMDWLDSPPVKGDHLVSLGKKGIGSVWLVLANRVVAPRKVRDHARYVITVQPMPELRWLTEWNENYQHPEVWVKGEPAYYMFWHPRGKKESKALV